jgi:hypothetical protein
MQWQTVAEARAKTRGSGRAAVAREAGGVEFLGASQRSNGGGSGIRRQP